MGGEGMVSVDGRWQRHATMGRYGCSNAVAESTSERGGCGERIGCEGDTRSIMLESTRGQKFCEKETIRTLATLIDSWLGIDNHVSSCNMISKVFFLSLSWFIVISNSFTFRFIFPMHPSADTFYTSSIKRHVVYILWTLFKHHNC